MLNTIDSLSLSSLQNFVRTAKVLKVEDASNISLTLKHEGETLGFNAKFAMGNLPLPNVGDDVLVSGESLDTCFIIGHIPAARIPQKRFNLEQDTKTGKTVLSIPDGDLDLRSEKGNIRLDAAKAIEFSSKDVLMETGKAQFDVVETNYQGLRLSASIAHTKLFLGKLNSTIGRLIEKAKNVYRQVDNLNQLKAGRMRSLIKGSYHLKSESINQKADKDVSIDGDKINLG